MTIPAGRIIPPLGGGERVDPETGEVRSDAEPAHLFWLPNAPAEGSVERRLLDALRAGRLLLEPFERAALGLREAFPAQVAPRSP